MQKQMTIKCRIIFTKLLFKLNKLFKCQSFIRKINTGINIFSKCTTGRTFKRFNKIYHFINTGINFIIIYTNINNLFATT